MNRLAAARLVTAFAAVILVTIAASPAAGQLAICREYDVKAGFLFNFLKLIDFPEDAFTGAPSELRVLVIGHDSFDGALDRLVAGKPVRGRPVVVAYSTAPPPDAKPHVAFISRSEQRHVKAVLAAFGKQPVLTISDIDGFAERGGMIGLVIRDGAVRFDINRAAAVQARLRISSRLLSLATLVGGDPAPSGH